MLAPVTWQHDTVVVVCGGNYFSADKKMHDTHLAEQLSSFTRVLYVDPPISHLTPFRRPELAILLHRPRLRMVSDSVAHLTPCVLPRPWSPPIDRSTGVLVRRAITAALRRLCAQPLAVVATWPFLDVFDACPAARRVYWWTDDPGSAADLWGMDRNRLIAGNRAIARRADLVIAVSEAAVREFCDAGIDARFFPNGCDTLTMARTDSDPLADDVHLPSPIAGFIGQVNARTDFTLLEAVADSGMSLLIVGPCANRELERLRALGARPNVAWVGPQPFDQIPAYLGHIDVGLVPYADTAFNRSSFPLKALEYLAAGRPVVSTSLPGVLWLDGADITTADTPPAFAGAVRQAAISARDDRAMARRRAFARPHGWSARAADLAEMLDLAGTPGSVISGITRNHNPIPDLWSSR